MDSHVSEHTQDTPSSFSAVLEDIFKQTQTEIRARNQHVHAAAHHTTSTLPPDLQFQDDTFRYEPLSDPALSYIYDILGENDVLLGNDPSLSYSELVAYEAKASEVAAILKEDSPSLSLNMDLNTQESKSSISSGATFVSEEPPYLQDLSYLDMEPFLCASHVSEPYRNSLLLNSLRGPQNPASVPSCMPIKAIGDGSSESQANRQSLTTKKAEKAGADDGASSHGHKPQKAQKRGDALKPRKESAAARKKGTGKARASKVGAHEYVDINDLLLQCAQAVGQNNTKSAVEILNKVKHHASPYGNGAQRLAYYFAEAMDARFSGTGWPLYLGRLRQRPSSAEILKATCMYMASCPFAKASHYFINQTILNIAKGASTLHILELQTTGYQYPSLFKALATRPGGPPQVRLFGVGFPHYSMIPAQTEVVLEGLQKAGRQLSECAASFGVPFQYTAWSGTREDLRMQDFVSPERNPDEVLVVISAYLLRYVMDDTLDSPMVRSKLLKMGRDINPDVYIQGIVTGSYSTPFFTRRFREALFHFESVYDMLDTFIERENTDRVVFESEFLGKAILNIVACEGMDVVERVDKYKHWQAVTEEAGFQQLPLDAEIRDKVQVMLKSWHKEYTVAEDNQYLLLGWKGRMLHAMSTWKASAPLEGGD